MLFLSEISPDISARSVANVNNTTQLLARCLRVTEPSYLCSALTGQVRVQAYLNAFTREKFPSAVSLHCHVTCLLAQFNCLPFLCVCCVIHTAIWYQSRSSEPLGFSFMLPWPCQAMQPKVRSGEQVTKNSADGMARTIAESLKVDERKETLVKRGYV